MRNYIRYIILLVLIIAGGLLVISVINKFSEPDVSKVDNGVKTEETTTKEKEPTLDVNTDDTTTNDKENNDTSSSSSNSSNNSTETDSI